MIYLLAACNICQERLRFSILLHYGQTSNHKGRCKWLESYKINKLRIMEVWIKTQTVVKVTIIPVSISAIISTVPGWLLMPRLIKASVAWQNTAMEYRAEDCIIISVMCVYRLRARTFAVVDEKIWAPITKDAVILVTAVKRKVIPSQMLYNRSNSMVPNLIPAYEKSNTARTILIEIDTIFICEHQETK